MARQSRVGTHKTKVFYDGTHTVVAYHNTPVVKFNSEEIILNTGGWRTVTTKTRMNQASRQFGLRYEVFQVDREWHVKFDGMVEPFDHQYFRIDRRAGA